MAISIKVGAAAEEAGAQKEAEVSPVPVSFNLNIRRSLDNDLMVYDHPDVDIVLKKDKIILFPTEVLNDIVYDTQDRFFLFLRKKGIIDPDTIRAGNVYGSMEAMLIGKEEERQVPLVVMNISKFIEQERPYFEYVEKYKQMEEDEYLDPDRADSTELGEVPQQADKGGIKPGYGRISPYFLSYIL